MTQRMTSQKNDAALDHSGKDVSSQSPATLQPATPRWASLVATFFGIGRLHPGPGTWASAVTVILWWPLASGVPTIFQPFWCASLAVLVVAVGIPAATRAARGVSLKDPQFVVIDEVAGQLITLIAAPVTWKCLLVAFILFRGFDIVKPPPVRMLERLPEGMGNRD